MTKKLYRSPNDKILGGVCGGIADYFEVDSTLVRLIFILITIIGGSGVLVYVLFWLLMPGNSGESAALNKEKVNAFAEEVKERAQDLSEKISEGLTEHKQERANGRRKEINKRHGRLWGWILVMAGVLLLLRNIFPWAFDFYAFHYWPLVIFIIGLVLILRSNKK